MGLPEKARAKGLPLPILPRWPGRLRPRSPRIGHAERSVANWAAGPPSPTGQPRWHQWRRLEPHHGGPALALYPPPWGEHASRAHRPRHHAAPRVFADFARPASATRAREHRPRPPVTSIAADRRPCAATDRGNSFLCARVPSDAVHASAPGNRRLWCTGWRTTWSYVPATPRTAPCSLRRLRLAPGGTGRILWSRRVLRPVGYMLCTRETCQCSAPACLIARRDRRFYAGEQFTSALRFLACRASVISQCAGSGTSR